MWGLENASRNAFLLAFFLNLRREPSITLPLGQEGVPAGGGSWGSGCFFWADTPVLPLQPG